MALCFGAMARVSINFKVCTARLFCKVHELGENDYTIKNIILFSKWILLATKFDSSSKMQMFHM